MASIAVSRVFWHLGIAVVVAGALALTSGRASAECGDHVMILGGQMGAGAVSGHDVDPWHPKPPCHGPGCSNRPSTPLAPLTVPASRVTDGRVCLVGAGDPDDDGSHGFEPLASDLDPVDRPSSIFHPPRA